MKTKIFFLPLFLLLSTLFSCRKAESVVSITISEVTSGVQYDKYKGFYVLNEGNMGSNKSTLDFFNYSNGFYYKNIYPSLNPSVVGELGDVGNDLKVYNNRLYAVINCSNLVEVMDLSTAKHISKISIPNCRYIAFSGDYGYVSSYAGAVDLDPNHRRGYVAKIDLATMTLCDTLTVGYQPEEMAVVDGKLFVANSGGYCAPNYDTKVSVIELSTFSVVDEIEVDINLHRLFSDSKGTVYVSSRGNNTDIPSKLYSIDSKTYEVALIDSVLAAHATIAGDTIYTYGSEIDFKLGKNINYFTKYDTKSKKIITRNCIDNEIAQKLDKPYALAVNPENGEIYVSDALTYVSPGVLYCFNSDGSLKWEVITGDIPNAIAFSPSTLSIN